MDRLGYTRYGAQGGDWGAQVTSRMAALDPERCAAIHLNMPVGARPEDPGAAHRRRNRPTSPPWDASSATSPATPTSREPSPRPSVSRLNDSPAGLLAWIVEKFRAWSDCDGHPENRFTRDQLITNVMLYWVTQTADLLGSTLLGDQPERRAQREAAVHHRSHRGRPLPQGGPALAPLGVERQYNLTYWAEMPRGGHFAAMEQPELFADDLRKFFRTVR